MFNIMNVSSHPTGKECESRYVDTLQCRYLDIYTPDTDHTPSSFWSWWLVTSYLQGAGRRQQGERTAASMELRL